MNGLSCDEESMTICSAVLIYNTSVRRTDRRTDVKPIAITCFSIENSAFYQKRATNS